VRTRVAAWLLVGVVAVTAGVVVGRWLLEGANAPEAAEAAAADFRSWFWEHRALDLMTQAALVFAGALGVSAILPGREEPPPARQHPETEQRSSAGRSLAGEQHSEPPSEGSP